MAAFFADENVHRGLTDALRALGHDVLTAQQAGRATKESLIPTKSLSRLASAARF